MAEQLRLYEAMFLLDSGAGLGPEAISELIGELIKRAGGEVEFLKRWDDRRLAYEIEGHKRGLYMLCFFKGPTNAPSILERDVQLSEQVLRVMVLNAEEMTQKKIDALVMPIDQESTPERSEGEARPNPPADRGRPATVAGPPDQGG